jgi:hypothetical protein
LTADICAIPEDEAGRREVFATGDDVGVNWRRVDDNSSTYHYTIYFVVLKDRV